MLIPDEGGYTPPLPDDAGPHERMLHKIYGFQTSIVSDTATDWGKTADGVRGLAAEVRGVITKLQGADPPWQGPAATAAYDTLHELAKTLDRRAGEVEDIRKGLQDAATAGSTAMTAYSTQVRSVSTAVDRTPYQPTDGGTFDATGYQAAVGAKQAAREAAAQQVLSTFTADMGSAAKQLPVEAPQDSVMIDPTSGGGSGTPPAGGGGGAPRGGSYVPPSGTLVGVHHVESGTPQNDPSGTRHPPVVQHPPVLVDPTVDEPTGVDPDPRGPGLDGPTTGTTAPTGPGSTGWAGTVSGAGPTSGPGLGGAGPMTAGGLLTGGAGLLGRALGRAGLGGAGRSGPVVTGSGAPVGRGTTGGGARGAGGANGARGVAAGGQGGPAGRGGRTGGIRGARTGGRYGVPKLGEAGHGGRGVAAGGGAGGRGKGKDDQRPEDVDALTHEDEETWFEGEDDATPPVWR